MKDAFAAAAAFSGILLIIALGLYLLSRWHQRIEKWSRDRRIIRDMAKYPTISRADLDVEAAATEAKYYDLPEYRRHRNKFEGRHYDAA